MQATIETTSSKACQSGVTEQFTTNTAMAKAQAWGTQGKAGRNPVHSTPGLTLYTGPEFTASQSQAPKVLPG